jgi:HAD superfamily hydrolase (TIGR01490 family)
MKTDTSRRIAAFFDLDGTLIARPSLERRFFAELRYRRAIPVVNYLLWLARAAWLAPQGIQMMRHANKTYLRGVRKGNDGGQPARQVLGRTIMPPRFFPEGVDRVAWHAQRGHSIFLVTGAPAPLAQEMGLALVVRLAVRGIAVSVTVCATQLEERGGRWTGRIIGDAMFGEAKGRAVRRLAIEKGFDLPECYAYGNCVNDRSMLETVGRPAVVNASRRMESLRRRRGWMALTWAERSNLALAGQAMRKRDEAEKVA